MQSLNKAQVIGFLPRNPEMRYTSGGTPVTSFTVVSLRPWADVGEQDKKSPEYINVVAWNKLAEICNQLLGTGSKVFIEGRVQTRTWDDEQGGRRYRTEIVAEDMVVLGEKHGGSSEFDPMREDAFQTLNRVQIIGNLTRDPEQRKLPSGTLLTTFGVATNRTWVSSDGNRQEGVEYHNVISWNTRADFAANKLKKGMKVFVEGRLQNRTWETPEGTKQNRTEIVADLIIVSTRMPAALREGEVGDAGDFDNYSSSYAATPIVDDDDDVFKTPSFVTGTKSEEDNTFTLPDSVVHETKDEDDLPF
ncbi:MAG: single-stranded DNA-binding protein [bacterium]